MTDESTDALLARLRHAARQEQFLDIVSAEEAMRRFRAAVPPGPLGTELVPLATSLGRIVAKTLPARADAPPFDRASVDGFALRAADTTGASEAVPVRLRLNAEVLACGVAPAIEVPPARRPPSPRAA